MVRLSDIYRPDSDSRDRSANNKNIPEAPEKKPYAGPNTEELYNDALMLAKTKADLVYSGKPVDISENDIRTIGNLLKGLDRDRKQLMSLFYENTPTDYLYAHMVNSCVLSLVLAKRMVFNREQLIIVSLASFFYDIGMARFRELYRRTGELDEYEKMEIEKHPAAGRNIINDTAFLGGKLKDKICEIIYRHHERENGSGYPERLGSEDIDNFTRIISISDVYEALTHDRAWRTAYNPAKAMEIVLGSKGRLFSVDSVRLLVEELSVFPVGSLVILNDGRKAEVVKINEQSPTSPVVRIFSEKSQKEDILDLSERKLFSIEDIAETR